MASNLSPTTSPRTLKPNAAGAVGSLSTSVPVSSTTTAEICDVGLPSSLLQSQSENSQKFAKKVSRQVTKRQSSDTQAFGFDGKRQKCRLKLARMLNSPKVELLIGALTVFNYAIIMIDIDLRAAGETTPTWIRCIGLICLVFYSSELAIRFFVERLTIVANPWNWLDIVVVTTGIVDEVCELVDVEFLNFTFLRIVRCFRLFRIVKSLVGSTHLKELRKLIRGIIGCLKTLFWGLALLFLFMTMWSTLAVELVHPVMKSVSERSAVWGDCERCSRSLSSVMTANLTFFQTIVAGDSWGLIAIPVIEHHPWTIIVFGGALVTLSVGIMNLIVAVLVDTASEARLGDTEARSLEAIEAEKREKKDLLKIFAKIDADMSGGLTIEELTESVARVPEFEQQLKVMDIQQEDLEQLFHILDEDGSGEINSSEFIEKFYRLKCGDIKTASTFVKHCVVHLKKKQDDFASKFGNMEMKLIDLKRSISGYIASEREIIRDRPWEEAARRESVHSRFSQLDKQLGDMITDMRMSFPGKLLNASGVHEEKLKEKMKKASSMESIFSSDLIKDARASLVHPRCDEPTSRRSQCSSLGGNASLGLTVPTTPTRPSPSSESKCRACPPRPKPSTPAQPKQTANQENLTNITNDALHLIGTKEDADIFDQWATSVDAFEEPMRPQLAVFSLKYR